jgi:hypothetical protein
LRPCEMLAEKVVAFVLGYAPDPPRVLPRLRGFVRRMRRRPRSRTQGSNRPAMLGRIIAEHAIAVNAATTASTAAVHIMRRYASTTATDARADADVLPNAIRARRQRRGRQAARPRCSPRTPGHPARSARTTVVSGAMHAVMPILANTRPGRSPSEYSGLAADNAEARSRRPLPGYRPPASLGCRCAAQDLRPCVSQRP